MRLPHHLLESPLFLFQEAEDLIMALGERVTAEEAAQIQHLAAAGLPPIVSEDALASMLGVNSGLIWSFVNRSRKHYRRFEIPKGRETRLIVAPRVGLKIIQKWLSVHLARQYEPADHVYGFVSGRSHIDAARIHVGAQWAYSVDITDFFGTTPMGLVAASLERLGFPNTAAELGAKLTCLDGVLAQGAPSSPVLSNMCFKDMDDQMIEVAEKYGCKMTRYADDIVFSGTGEFNDALREELRSRFSSHGVWSLSKRKELVQPLKGRIKIHSFLIGAESIKLTKGYRNKLRGYAHVIEKRGANADEVATLRGHLNYALHVERIENQSSGLSAERVRTALSSSSGASKESNRFFGNVRKGIRNLLKGI